MRSLFLRFFLSFWLLIGLIIGGAAVGGFLYAERLQETIEDFEAGESMLEAGAILERGGPQALARWLADLPQDDGVVVFILDERGRDILKRRLPYGVSRVYQRHQSRMQRFRRDDGPPRDFRRSRFMPQLVAPDGAIYTMLVAPARSPGSFWSSSDIRILLLIFALLTSGLVSYALAAALSRPVRKLRDATVALADGDLDVRVADTIGKRRDELGMLGRDFDSMAEKLQRAAQQQAELSRNISHELRSPLARMRVAVELARSKAGELPEFDRLNREAERLDALIGQVLSFSRLEADPQRNAAPVDLVDVINEVAENVRFECGDTQRVVVDAAITGRASIRGHREALVSAVENIARNAVRHNAPECDISISLNTDDQHAYIEIKDKGAGVDDDDLPRLFDAFFRTRDSVLNDGNGGTGLGLAIARRAVELHGGSIAARNRASGGLAVRISLPLG